jgi:hypothetical protein
MSTGSALGCILLALVFIVACVLFGPLLLIWGINTLILGYIPNSGQIPYELFTHQWAAALLCGGTLGGVLSGFGKSKK